MKTWLITGCSTGLGKSLAKAVLRAWRQRRRHGPQPDLGGRPRVGLSRDGGSCGA